MTTAGALAGAAFFTRATLSEVDFRKVSLESVAPSGCVLEHCDFRDIVFDRRLLPLFQSRPRNVFRDCRFEGADLRRATPGQSRFERCSFTGARLDEWSVTTAEFVDCSFGGALVGVTFHGKPWGREAERLDPSRSVNEFRGNDFREAELVGCAFIRGIALDQQQWPASDRYVRLDHFHHRLTLGRAEILRWKDRESRGPALDLVQSLSLRYREQNEVIASRVEERSAVPADVQRRVWEALAGAL